MARLSSAILLFLYLAFTNIITTNAFSIYANFSTFEPSSNPVPADFLALSVEWQQVIKSFMKYYRGTATNIPNPIMIRLLRNLAAEVNYASMPTIRVGGNSATIQWWNGSSLVRPNAASYPVSFRHFGAMETVAHNAGIKLVANIGMLNGTDPSAATDFIASGILANINYKNLLAIELGNEPELYVRNGRRDPTWDYFTQTPIEFQTYLASIAAAIPSMPTTNYFWGPAMTPTGNNQNFLAASLPAVNGISLHRYGIDGCNSSESPSMNLLLADPTVNTYKFIRNDIINATALGHPLGTRQVIATEINSASCGGVANISNTFGAALWGVDTFLTLATNNFTKAFVHGLQGVYPKSTPNSYAPWVQNLHNNSVIVMPIYYAMVQTNRILGGANAVVRAVHFSIVDTTGMSDPTITTPNIKVYMVTRGTSTNIVVIHKDLGMPNVTVAIDVANIPNDTGSAVLERMKAPSVYTSRDIRLAGYTLDWTSDGGFRGSRVSAVVTPTSGSYYIGVYQGSVAVLYAGTQSILSTVGALN
ncbi:hypothetical protein SmJEL517_g01147 [Synchytrium microbalum]|uniref:Beta-glucuronidase n=1 Tax=Synchytrium microbalum TaxID=1806994 RepID=A0A507CBA6_9FUNG|nr:uncharacterized protein SmJEL517_g01147 [Synchytrium microbalum]TPX36751.1 hypothetical protein SmJEL517_g01147 [Synchytrium microbalum]